MLGNNTEICRISVHVFCRKCQAITQNQHFFNMENSRLHMTVTFKVMTWPSDYVLSQCVPLSVMNVPSFWSGYQTVANSARFVCWIHPMGVAFLFQIPGGTIEDSKVLKGVMINKDVVHPKMRRYGLIYCIIGRCC